MLDADPFLEGTAPLRTVRPELRGKVLTHAGPPIAYRDMAGPMGGAVWAAAMFEGWAKTAAEADRPAAAGKIRFVANHDVGGVGGMAGVVSPSMRVHVVRDRTSGETTFAIQEFDAYFGLHSPAAVEEIRRWNRVYMPTIDRAVKRLGGLALKPIEAQAIRSGDDLHCLTIAATDRLLASLAPAIVATSNDKDAAATLGVLGAFPHLAYLPLSMASAKVAALAAEGIAGSSVVTVMARNGVQVGLQISAFPGRWFTAPAPRISTVFFPGFGPGDDNPDLGDRAITEVGGKGAFAAVAAPALAHEVGLTVAEAAAVTEQMARITVGRHTNLIAPQTGQGLPVGIDAHLVLATGVQPRIFTAVAHHQPGFPIIGLGNSVFPRAPFEQAAAAVAA
jgi:hypothetical protein